MNKERKLEAIKEYLKSAKLEGQSLRNRAAILTEEIKEHNEFLERLEKAIVDILEKDEVMELSALDHIPF